MFAAAPRPWTGTLDEITMHLPTGRANIFHQGRPRTQQQQVPAEAGGPTPGRRALPPGRPGLTRVPRNLVGRWKCHVHQRVVVVTQVYTSA